MLHLVTLFVPLIGFGVLFTFNSGYPTPSQSLESVERPIDGRLCQVFISEINTDNPGSNEKQFIELETVCLSKRKIKNPFAGYKLVVVRGHPLAIVIVVNLAKILEGVSDKKYIVLGSSNVEPTVDIDLSSGNIESIYMNNGSVNILPVGDDSPYGIILIYNKSPIITREIKLYRREDGRFIEFNLYKDDLIQKYILENAKDLAVYGRKAETSGCLFFDLVWPEGSIADSSKKYLLRDWDSETNISYDYTLNRCSSDVIGFKPESFKYGLGSPSAVNNCFGRGFFMEEIIDNISPFIPLSIASAESLGECEPPSKRIRRERYRDASSVKIHNLIQKASVQKRTCTSRFDSSYSFASTSKEISTLNNLLMRSNSSPVVPFYSQNAYNNTWKNLCKEYLPKQGSILDNEEVQKWIDIEVTNNECRFSCSACKFYFKYNFRQDIKQKHEIQTPSGYFSKCIYENQRQIKDHSKLEVHSAAVKFQYDASKAATKDEFISALQKAEADENILLLPTIRLVKFVYAEVLADVPFRKHTIFMQTLTSLGVNIGIHHQHEAAAQSIMSIISESFHKTLLEHLVDQKKPFSLMVDGTTDIRNLPLLICYLQTLEDGYPIVYFYALIYLENGESATETFNSFKGQLIKDEVIQPGFINFFKQNLIGLSTDGASVNVGTERSFHTLTNAFIERHVPLVHCFSHKLQLTINRAIRKQKDETFLNYFKWFEKSTNEFYVYYLSRGSKRWLHLVDVGTQVGIKPRRMKRFLEVRWAASEYEIMQSLVYDYDILKHDLLEISSDKEFALIARNTALGLYSLIEDKTYSVVLREMLDLLEVYKGMSLKFQESAGILCDKSGILEKGIEEFTFLKSNVGIHVSAFLNNCSCPGICEEGECSLVQFDSCAEVYYNNFVLTKVNNNSIPMSVYREMLYDAIIKEMHYYFDLELLKSFELFNPKAIELPVCQHADLTLKENPEGMCTPYFEEQILDKYTVEYDKLSKVCSFYGISNSSCVDFGTQWESLINRLSQLPTAIQNFNNEDASEFWPMALTLDELPWTNLTRQIVELVLVTAMTSSDCERGFSYVTRLKSQERSSLTPRVLENIVRIKVNGPKDIANFNAGKYSRIFLRKHVRVDDYGSMGGRPPNEESKKFFKESRLF